ncbi:MAG: hypothetical protein HZC41_08720 [Chloroflexi bacterium]|nr:hypothetical protein [Chloroflexota bacterium]
MKNGAYFNAAYENQYLESDHFDPEGGDFEDMEMLLGEEEDSSLEDMELVYEDPETWETGEPEGDQFIGGLFKIAKPLLRQVVPQIATAVGGKLAGQRGASIANMIARNVLREAEAEGDHELDPEGDPESELQALGVNPEVLAEMAYYAQQAAETDNEEEADHFIGAIANLAGQILPSLLGETDQELTYESEGEGDQFLPLLAAAAPMIGKVASIGAPLIGKGVRAIGRLFRRSPRRVRRTLMPTLPRIAMRSAQRVANVARSAATTRRPVTPPQVARAVTGSVARSMAQTLATPARVQAAVVRNRALARRYRVSGTLTLRPARRRVIRRAF